MDGGEVIVIINSASDGNARSVSERPSHRQLGNAFDRPGITTRMTLDGLIYEAGLVCVVWQFSETPHLALLVGGAFVFAWMLLIRTGMGMIPAIGGRDGQ